MALNRTTMAGMTTAGSHAPAVNLDTTTTRRTMPVAIAPTKLTVIRACQPGSRCRRWYRTMPDWLSVKPVNTPTAHRDEGGRLAAEGDDEHGRHDREHDDAVGEDEAVAAVLELVGQELVAGDDRRQTREVGVRRVRGQDQDREGGELQHVVEERVGTEHLRAQDRQERLVLGGGGVEPAGQQPQPEEGRPQDHGHGGQGPPRCGSPASGTRARRRRSPRRRSARRHLTRRRGGG